MTRATTMLTVLAFAALPVLFGATEAEAQVQDDDFFTTAEREGFTTWRTGVRDAELEARFTPGREYTVFAPTDDAYRAVPAEQRNMWQTDRAAHRAAVGHTIVEGRLTAEDLRQRQYVTTIDGERLPVRTEGDRIMVGDATVQRADVAAGDGLIHGVDRVTWPATAAERVRDPVRKN